MQRMTIPPQLDLNNPNLDTSLYAELSIAYNEAMRITQYGLNLFLCNTGKREGFVEFRGFFVNSVLRRFASIIADHGHKLDAKLCLDVIYNSNAQRKRRLMVIK